MSRAVVPAALIGDPVELYKLVTREIPKPSPGNVLLRMVLRPVNPADSLVVQMGFWQDLDLEKVTVGSEGVGRVHELGDGVTNFTKGQRVIPLNFSRYSLEGFGFWRDFKEAMIESLSPDRVGKVFLESYEPGPGGKVFLEGGVSS